MSEQEAEKECTSNIVTVTLNGQLDSARECKLYEHQACGEDCPSLVGEDSALCGWMSSPELNVM